MEAQEESCAGPPLSVQPLTPTHHGHCCKATLYTSEEATRSRFDQLIENFNNWLATRPSPYKSSHWLPSMADQSDAEEQASHRLSMLSKTLWTWRESVSDSRRWRVCVEIDARNCLRRAFHDWRLHIYHCILDKLAEEYTEQGRTTALQAWFHIWHERACVREGERVLLTRVTSLLEQRLCGRALCEWARVTRISLLEQRLCGRALCEWARVTRISLLEQRLCGRALCGWARVTRLSRWTKARSQLCVRRCWSLWRGGVAKQRSLLEAAKKKHEVLSLSHALHTWRRQLHAHIAARDYLSLGLLSKCFTVWMELTEWSHTESALAFVGRLQELLCRDPTVTYPTMVSSLTLASRNLRLGDGGLSGEESTSDLPSQHECKVESTGSSHDDDLCPCLHTELLSSVEEVKQLLLSDLSDSISSSSHHYIISSEDVTQIVEPPPPVVAMATCCVQHLRLHCCSKAFNSWRLYAMISLRLEHAQIWSKWRTTKRMFHCWRDLAASRTQLQNSSTHSLMCLCLKRWHRTVRDLRQDREATLLRRAQLLSRVWAVWRRELVRERVSMWGVRTSRDLLLSQVIRYPLLCTVTECAIHSCRYSQHGR
ncbi:uncharacterized protein LOC135334198 isoform X2 [Halichondria panicea]|uniref:uncharacterized protein LOC135334198 isoform X2 n=1 Tax=Halichondria panicea TaxID=6063 RepID=UPI00312B69AE